MSYQRGIDASCEDAALYDSVVYCLTHYGNCVASYLGVSDAGGVVPSVARIGRYKSHPWEDEACRGAYTLIMDELEPGVDEVKVLDEKSSNASKKKNAPSAHDGGDDDDIMSDTEDGPCPKTLSEAPIPTQYVIVLTGSSPDASKCATIYAYYKTVLHSECIYPSALNGAGVVCAPGQREEDANDEQYGDVTPVMMDGRILVRLSRSNISSYVTPVRYVHPMLWSCLCVCANNTSSSMTPAELPVYKIYHIIGHSTNGDMYAVFPEKNPASIYTVLITNDHTVPPWAFIDCRTVVTAEQRTVLRNKQRSNPTSFLVEKTVIYREHSSVLYHHVSSRVGTKAPYFFNMEVQDVETGQSYSFAEVSEAVETVTMSWFAKETQHLVLLHRSQPSQILVPSPRASDGKTTAAIVSSSSSSSSSSTSFFSAGHERKSHPQKPANLPNLNVGAKSPTTRAADALATAIVMAHEAEQKKMGQSHRSANKS